MEEIDTISNTVKHILEVDEKSRNSDKWLIIETLRALGFKIYIDYKELENMPSFETISRARRKIQEETPSLRSNEQVEDMRKERQDEFKGYFSKNTGSVLIQSNSFQRSRGIEVKTFIKER